MDEDEDAGFSGSDNEYESNSAHAVTPAMHVVLPTVPPSSTVVSPVVHNVTDLSQYVSILEVEKIKEKLEEVMQENEDLVEKKQVSPFFITLISAEC